MIFMNENECPSTRKDAFIMQKPFEELYNQMDMVECAIELLEGHYFSSSRTNFKSDRQLQKQFASQYEQIKLQIAIVQLLFEECMEYINMLRGTSTLYGDALMRTVECKKKIHFLMGEE